MSTALKCRYIYSISFYYSAKSKQSDNMFLIKQGTSLSNTKTGSSFTYTIIIIDISDQVNTLQSKFRLTVIPNSREAGTRFTVDKVTNI